MDFGDCKFSDIIKKWMNSSNQLWEKSTKMRKRLKDWENLRPCEAEMFVYILSRWLIILSVVRK